MGTNAAEVSGPPVQRVPPALASSIGAHTCARCDRHDVAIPAFRRSVQRLGHQVRVSAHSPTESDMTTTNHRDGDLYVRVTGLEDHRTGDAWRRCYQSGDERAQFSHPARSSANV